MKNREIEVSARDGSGIVVNASLAYCECGCEQWFVYAVMGRTGTHLHLQCADCGVTECGGDCIADEAPIARGDVGRVTGEDDQAGIKKEPGQG